MIMSLVEKHLSLQREKPIIITMILKYLNATTLHKHIPRLAFVVQHSQTTLISLQNQQFTLLIRELANNKNTGPNMIITSKQDLITYVPHQPPRIKPNSLVIQSNTDLDGTVVLK
jgi:hypothetical protein